MNTDGFFSRLDLDRRPGEKIYTVFLKAQVEKKMPEGIEEMIHVNTNNYNSG